MISDSPLEAIVINRPLTLCCEGWLCVACSIVYDAGKAR